MIPGILAAPAAQTAWSIVKRFWWAVPIAALTVALVLTRGTLSSVKDDLETQRRAVAAEEAEHAITRSSVDRLEAQVSQQNAIILERARALEAAKEQAAADVAAADQKWQATADQVERLKSLARAPAKPGCEASKQLLKELEGL